MQIPKTEGFPVGEGSQSDLFKEMFKEPLKALEP